jgi:curved DNA-binding protein
MWNAETEMIDYFELLQISPNADNETIHRVYLFLAARLHPDNLKTGDAMKFQLVKTAYDVLSNPTRRAEYDKKCLREPPQPLSTSIDFMDQLEGELNRRMAVLAVLYYRRRTNSNLPNVSLAEIEERMGFPRDYLDFTLWYLDKKRYIARSDNATYSLTADGVDFVEKERVALPILNGLLASNSEPSAQDVAQACEEAAIYAPEMPPVDMRPARVSAPIVLPSPGKAQVDRRPDKADRRVGAPDLRVTKVERRKDTRDRRANAKGRQTVNDRILEIYHT